MSNPLGSLNKDLLPPLLDDGDFGIVLVDRYHRVRYWNRWMSQASGIERTRAVGKSLSDLFPGRVSTRLGTAIEDCFLIGVPAVLSPSLNRKVLPLKAAHLESRRFDHMQQLIKLRPLMQDGKTAYCVIEISDVTVAVERDLLLRERAAEMSALAEKTAASEARMRAVLLNSSDAIFLCTPDHEPEALNPAASALTGEGGDPDIAGLLRELLPDPPKDPVLSPRVRLDKTTGVTEIELCPKERSKLSMEVRVSAVTSGSEHLFMVNLRDITQRKRYEAGLRDTMSELERSNSELEQFAYAASHDLQEPLRMISSYTQLLSRRYRGQLDETADEFIDFAVDGAIRMQTMIDDLLTFSRVGREKRPFTLVAMDQVIEGVKANLRRQLAETDATIETGSLPAISGDPSQLLMLFQNLISNGIKYRGEAAPVVRIQAEQHALVWRFTVQDNGIGIDEKHHQAVFEIFKRLHARDRYPGTGIGLALCKRIVERHQGTISLTSTPGTGTKVIIELPKADTAA